MRLDIRDTFPSGMEEYLAYNGWHFNKKLCDYAVSRMYKRNANGTKAYITPYTKEAVDDLLSRYGITVEKHGYDYVYVANMARADFWNSSIADEGKLALFIKDYVGDADAYEGMPMTRFYADVIGSGEPVEWEDML